MIKNCPVCGFKIEYLSNTNNDDIRGQCRLIESLKECVITRQPFAQSHYESYYQNNILHVEWFYLEKFIVHNYYDLNKSVIYSTEEYKLLIQMPIIKIIDALATEKYIEKVLLFS